MSFKSFVTHRMHIGTQIQGIVTALVVMIIIAIVTGLRMAGGVEVTVQKSRASIVELNQLAELSLTVKEVQISILGLQEDINHFAATYDQAGAPAIVDALREADEFSAHFADSSGKVKSLANSLNLKDIDKAIDDARGLFPAYLDHGKRLARAYYTPGSQDEWELMGGFDAAGDRLANAVGVLSVAVDRERGTETFEIDQTSSEALRSVHTLDVLLRVVAAIALAATIGIFIYARAAVTRPLQALVRTLQSLARGEIDHAIFQSDRADEIGLLAQSVSAVKQASIEQSRREVERSLSQMRDLADATVEGLVICDGHQLVATNRSFEELTGIRAGDLHLSNISGVIRNASALESLEKEPERPVEVELECESGGSVPVEIVGRRIAYLGKQHRVFAVRDLRERRKAEESIHFLARHDPLTKLANRHWFREEMEIALRRVGRGDQIAVLCLDLDHFKQVNDTLGYPIGDALLAAVAERLKENVRQGDVIARMGGDAFAIIQVGAAQPDGARILAERLIQKLGAPFEIEGHHIAIGTSVGIAIAPNDGDQTDTLIKKSDLALYKSKSEGRGAFKLFEAGMDEMLLARRTLEADLRKALASNEFELFYQPQVEAKTRKVRSFEALLRWRHPERGLVPPLDFIPTAEEIGLMGPIGAWVLKQACRDAKNWPDNIGVAVNISAAQFRNNPLDRDVGDALSGSGLSPHRLELELTESVLLENTERVIETLSNLRATGIKIAMDDFGTGYSSLSYLSRFPIDKIKIDRSFVNASGEEASSLAVIRAVVGLTSSLGMTSTAEGVETLEQLSLLQVEGCTEVQGYFFSKPVPAENIPGLLVALTPQMIRAA